MEKISIGKILRRRREELDLTQRQIAIHVGVTESAVSRWESGEIDNMRRDRIAKLADILQISPLVIMGAEEFDNKPPTLSFEQATILSCFDDMNQEGKELALSVIRSLRAAHPKKLSKRSSAPVVQSNRNGDNYYNAAGTQVNAQ